MRVHVHFSIARLPPTFLVALVVVFMGPYKVWHCDQAKKAFPVLYITVTCCLFITDCLLVYYTVRVYMSMGIKLYRLITKFQANQLSNLVSI